METRELANRLKRIDEEARVFDSYAETDADVFSSVGVYDVMKSAGLENGWKRDRLDIQTGIALTNDVMKNVPKSEVELNKCVKTMVEDLLDIETASSTSELHRERQIQIINGANHILGLGATGKDLSADTTLSEKELNDKAVSLLVKIMKTKILPELIRTENTVPVEKAEPCSIQNAASLAAATYMEIPNHDILPIVRGTAAAVGTNCKFGVTADTIGTGLLFLAAASTIMLACTAGGSIVSSIAGQVIEKQGLSSVFPIVIEDLRFLFDTIKNWIKLTGGLATGGLVACFVGEQQRKKNSQIAGSDDLVTVKSVEVEEWTDENHCQHICHVDA